MTGLTYNYLDGNTGSGGAGDIFLSNMIPLEQNIGQNNWGHQIRIMERLLPLILQEISM